MEQLIEFAGNHLILIGALAVVTVLLVQNLVTASDKQSIQPQVATSLINREEAVVLDVRPMDDFNHGHIVNAINIPASSMKNQLNQLKKYRNKPIIVTCRSGAQSGSICKQLRKEGFERVYNLHGGLLAWQNANQPLSHKK